MGNQLTATKDFNAAALWIERIDVSAEERHYLFKKLTRLGVDGDDTNGAVYAYRQLGASDDPELAKNLIGAVAKSQFEQAQWMAGAMPAGSVREAALKELVTEVPDSRKLDEVNRWLTNQGSNPDFDATYRLIAEKYIESDPQSACRAIAMMTDSASGRLELQYQYGHEWLRTDYAAAVKELPAQTVGSFGRVEALRVQFAEIYPEIASVTITLKKPENVGKNQ